MNNNDIDDDLSAAGSPDLSNVAPGKNVASGP